MDVLRAFLRFAIPLLPDLVKTARAFFQSNPQYGPAPPDINAWLAIDDRIDAELARRRAAEAAEKP